MQIEKVAILLAILLILDIGFNIYRIQALNRVADNLIQALNRVADNLIQRLNAVEKKPLP